MHQSADNLHRCASTRLAACSVVACLALLAGCEEEGIRTYWAPKDPPRPAMKLPADAAPPADVDLAWDVPTTWHAAEIPAAQRAFTVASFHANTAAPEEEHVTITVTRLTGEGGGAVANINRWRGQVGLPPIAKLEEQPMERVDTGVGPAAILDLVGDKGRTLGAILPRAETNETWFWKATAEAARLEGVKAELVAMVATVKPAEPQAAPAEGGAP